VSARLVAVVLTLTLGACAMMPKPEELLLSRSILTTEAPTDTFARHDQTTFTDTDTIHLISIVTWTNPHAGAGMREVLWRWQVNADKSITGNRHISFLQTPYELYADIPASVLGPGPHKVECFVDEQLVDSREFTVEGP
jgi:DNA mismatch repair protein MutH